MVCALLKGSLDEGSKLSLDDYVGCNVWFTVII